MIGRKAGIAWSVLSVAFFASGAGAAEDEEGWARPRIRGVFSIGGDFGFKDLVRFTFTNGESASLKANQGLTAALGVSVPTTSDGLFETRATAGVKYAQLNASNGEVTWLAFPIEVLQLVHYQAFGFGAGVSYELFPSLSGSGVAGGVNAKFSHPFGFVAQLEYTWFAKQRTGWGFSGLQVGARYGVMRFAGDNVQTFAAHTVGGVLSVLF